MTDKNLLSHLPTDTETLEAFVVDISGALRGKWVPRENMEKVFKSGLRIPRSIYAVDIWGQDVLPAGLVAETGDNDGICRAVPSSLKPIPWSPRPLAQVLMSMEDGNGKPFFADPRHVLAKVLSLYKKEGLTPVVAAELEFYLLDCKPDERGRPQPPLSPVTGKRVHAAQILGLGETAEFSNVLSDIASACRTQDIPADTIISENGPGQFEINLYHVPDALQAADHAVLLKRAIKGVASQHGMSATFMAKPYAGQSGSGMHVHFSVLDKKGKNIFAGKDAKGTPALKHAIGGLMAAMQDSMAILAPNANSYRRFRAGSHAPTKIAWGYDNRSCSLRVPESDIDATRIEYRVAGADVNPYLVLAVILAAALDGLKKKTAPPPPVKGNAYAGKAKTLPDTWDAALTLFKDSKFIEKYLGRDYKKLYLACKLQEKETLASEVTSAEHDAYLRDV
jgi:glutamine synthetase